MILVAMIGILVAAGLVAWAAERIDARAPRWVAAAALGADFVLAVAAWVRFSPALSLAAGPAWAVEARAAWIPRFGISFHLAMDGLSLLLIALTFFLGFIAVLAGWTEIRSRTGFFHFNLLWVLAGIAGVFLAVDLFLFYFFWELMLVPMYFLISIWGHEKRAAASVKFFLFTQAGGLAMLLSILALYFIHGRTTGVYTFEYGELVGTPLGPAAVWIMLGFVLAFFVKAAAVPVHTWLPDAHAQAPTGGSVILAGLLLKTGAYGLLRFVLPLFPTLLPGLAPVGMALGVAGILYGAKLAFAQSDLKRLVAYTSVSHMGFVLVGIFSLDRMAMEGAVLQMLCHGLSTGALFMLAGAVMERLHTRDMDRMGGLWEEFPRMGMAGMIFALASLGLLGLGNFVAEFLVAAGTFAVSPGFAIAASLGFIASTVYALSMVQRVFHGPKTVTGAGSDLGPRELVAFGLMAAALLWLGLYPGRALRTARPVVTSIVRIAAPERTALGAPAGSGESEKSDGGPGTAVRAPKRGEP